MFDFDPTEVKAAAQNCGAFKLAARFWTAKVAFKIGDEGYLLEVSNGDLVDFRRDDLSTGADVTIAGPAESWARFLQRTPPPGFQDPLFFAGGAGFQVEGDGVKALGPYYLAIQEFLYVLRAVKSGRRPDALSAEVDRDFDDVVGRYMYVDIEGVQHRIYFEESGSGEIPLLLQHTAGSDARQWRHIHEDPDYKKLCRIISYDLPFHGRSLPPTSQRWWEKPYRLTKSFLMEALVAISDKLELDRPIFMGCSVGGMLAPDLAFYHPDKFRAVIALNGALGADKTVQSVGSSIWELWSDPRVGAQWTMALMRSNLSPTSPEIYRRESMWVYGQAAPTINEGDIYYYAFDHDLTEEQAKQIDTSKVAVYLLTGEYDGLALMDQGTARLADAISGSRFQIVPGLGHFGPAEDPERAKAALLPVLHEIAAARVPISA